MDGYFMDILVYDLDLVSVVKERLHGASTPFEIVRNEWRKDYERQRYAFLRLRTSSKEEGRRLRHELGKCEFVRTSWPSGVSIFTISSAEEYKRPKKKKKQHGYFQTGTVLGHAKRYPGV